MSIDGSRDEVSSPPQAGAADRLPVELKTSTREFLKALTSPTRQRIMLLFARGAELSVGEVAEQIGIGQSTASEQLSILRRAGIVTSRREGKVVLYRSDRDGALEVLADLQAYLQTCC
ncbi:DNA-binding transcriptional ArsR family regulator [Pseudonocardia hierapolitana]|uniref:DNA-binding transcriptional ArsR family regulator n=1 Tax=Pseudonocardia hierapolitana TaxID=1128676 RepID=A0A561T172_9PSEU|nr:metalloregulator ArsR/SmtB family transcription factor [Pseudonocardia hierapolitana]TWF80862.1 DNA-binding transcriptional ArsR family regulator [Pseudonocardia hierapolitana]